LYSGSIVIIPVVALLVLPTTTAAQSNGAYSADGPCGSSWATGE
jgi:hypothetical protein